jgi:hypothetical protein
MRGKFLPVLFNAEVAFNVSGYVGLGLLVPLGLLAIFNVVRGLMRVTSLDAGRHPLVRKLRPFGDPMAAAAEIDGEVSGGSVLALGPATVTGSWILWPTRFRMIAVRIEDVVWAYHQVTSGRHTAMLFTRDGKIRPIWLKKDAVDELLRTVTGRVPWAFAGFDVKRLKTWSKRPHEIITMADERQKLWTPTTRSS